MGFLKPRTVLFAVLLILVSAQFGAAIRPWHWQSEQLLRKVVPNFESLQKGSVPPSGGSPCSNIPGGSGHCVVNGINVAGSLVRSPPPPSVFPAGIEAIKFAAAATSIGE